MFDALARTHFAVGYDDVSFGYVVVVVVLIQRNSKFNWLIEHIVHCAWFAWEIVNRIQQQDSNQIIRQFIQNRQHNKWMNGAKEEKNQFSIVINRLTEPLWISNGPTIVIKFSDRTQSLAIVAQTVHSLARQPRYNFFLHENQFFAHFATFIHLRNGHQCACSSISTPQFDSSVCDSQLQYKLHAAWSLALAIQIGQIKLRLCNGALFPVAVCKLNKTASI